LRNRQQAGAFKQLSRTPKIAQESRDKALDVEITYWQWTLCAIAQYTSLQWQISWPRFTAFYMVFSEDPKRSDHKIVRITCKFALLRVCPETSSGIAELSEHEAN
jgi:hypothetical protein